MGEEVAFEALVQRHLDLVYSAALRQLDGDHCHAEDVAQSMFVELYRKAGGCWGILRFPAGSTPQRASKREASSARSCAGLSGSIGHTPCRPSTVKPLL